MFYRTVILAVDRVQIYAKTKSWILWCDWKCIQTTFYQLSEILWFFFFGKHGSEMIFNWSRNFQETRTK